MTKQSDSFKAKMNHTATPATLTTGSIHCVQKKNTHSHFLSYLHE